MGQVITQYKGGVLFESQLGDHRLTIEGPDSWGGKNRGPMPPQIFMASIGSCVGVLVAHFCDTHGLDCTGLEVAVDYDSADHPVRFTNLNVSINLPNAQCDDDCTKKALQSVAEHCPVHETIATLEKINFTINTKQS